VLLKELAPIHAAGHDAADLKISTCLEETRVALLSELDSWLIESNSPQFFWLNGLAGTGKSTVARTFCERTAARNGGVYLASFFISRHADDRRKALNVFHTLVYQLAARHKSMRRAVCDVLRAEPDLLSKSLDLQVPKLLSPLLLHMPSSIQTVIVIDALDECDKDDNGREAGRLIPLLMHTLRAASQKTSLLMTSRDEVSIRAMFAESTGGTLEQMILRLHDIDKSIVRGDLERYFRHHLRRIALRDRTLRADEWPGASALEQLLARTGVLFVYAATVVRFLDIEDFAPSVQLQRVMDGDSTSAAATYGMLDSLYMHILAAAAKSKGGLGALEDVLAKRVRCLTGTIVCLQQALPVQDIAALMGLNEYETGQTLARLGSILIYERDEPIRIFHPSFPDFLTDPSRCLDGRFRLQASEGHSEIALCCLKVMNKRLRYDICGTEKPWASNEEVVRLVHALENLGSLRYACIYWAVHLRLAGKPDSSLTAGLVSFCDHHLLHWIEFLSLIDKLSCVDEYLPGALEWCQASSCPFRMCMN
jgi:hypothetical protein